MSYPRPRRSVVSIGQALLGLVFIGAAQAAEVQAEGPLVKLVNCMRANLPVSTRSQDLELRTTDRAGSVRVLSGRLLSRRSNGKASITLRITAPADMQGAALLATPGKSGGQDYYLYLPAVGKPRRIDGGSGGNLFGTGLGYAELQQMGEAFASAAVSMGAAGTVSGRKVQELVALTADPRSPYDTMSLQVDTTSCLPLAADFKAGDKLIKQLRVAPTSINHNAGFWMAGSTTVRDLRTGLVTTITASNARDGVSLSASDFNPKNFFSP